MRLTLVATVFGLLGCAGSGSDPGSVVQGLSQEQIDQTQWLFNAEASDLVAAADLQGPAAGYEIVRVRRFDDAIVIWNPSVVGENPDVLRGADAGGIRPGGGGGDVGSPDDNHGSAQVGDVFAGRQLVHGIFDPDYTSTDDDFGLERFDEGLLQALQGEEGFFVFHPGCA